MDSSTSFVPTRPRGTRLRMTMKAHFGDPINFAIALKEATNRAREQAGLRRKVRLFHDPSLSQQVWKSVAAPCSRARLGVASTLLKIIDQQKKAATIFSRGPFSRRNFHFLIHRFRHFFNDNPMSRYCPPCVWRQWATSTFSPPIFSALRAASVMATFS